MNIVILTKAPFPEGSAVSTYVLNTCRTMVAAGHRVSVLGCLRGTDKSWPVTSSIDGIDYHNFDANQAGRVKTYLFDRYWSSYAVHFLQRIKAVDLVYLYGGDRDTAVCIFRYCKKRAIRYGAFNCEWYTEESFAQNTPTKMIENIVGLIPYNAEHANCAILISSLLCNYFSEHNVPSVMIPNIVDLQDKKWNVRKSCPKDDVLKIAYAGVPGVGKDELGTVVEAASTLPEEMKNRVQLHIYGSTPEVLWKYLKEQGISDPEKLDFIHCHGRMKQSEMPRFLNDCHYTILIRKPSVRTNAGFSTKMVESFAAGIPMIANITGDIATYLRDGENGIVVQDETVSACREAVIRALNMLQSNNAMRENALKTAERYFDYRMYVETMRDFLKQFC